MLKYIYFFKDAEVNENAESKKIKIKNRRIIKVWKIKCDKKMKLKTDVKKLF